MAELDLDELRRRLAGAGHHRRHPAGRRRVQPHLSGRARRPGGGDQGRSARRRAGRAPRRAAPGPHHQSACRNRVPVPEVLWEDPGDPPHDPAAVCDVACRRRLRGAAFRRLPRRRRFGRALPQCVPGHGRPAQPVADRPRLGGEPVIDPVAEVQRWCDTLQTVDAALVPGWQGVRDALLSARQRLWGPAWCTVTSGWAT